MLFEYGTCIQTGMKSPDKNSFFIEFESKWHFDANFVENTKTCYNNDSSIQFRILSASKMSVLNKGTMRLTERGENDEN